METSGFQQIFQIFGQIYNQISQNLLFLAEFPKVAIFWLILQTNFKKIGHFCLNFQIFDQISDNQSF